MNDNQMTPQESRATWGLGTVFSLRMLGMFMVLPVLTTYGMKLSGASETLIGIAIGIYGLAQAVFQIPFGLLSDRVGRKPLIIFGLVIFCIGSIVAASTESIWGVIIGRALQGSGAIAAAVMALLSDLTREQNRTKAMAFIGISFGITFAIAMVLGPIITHAWGLHALFWAIAALTILGIIITVAVVPSPATHILNRESSMVKGSFGKVMSNAKLLKLNFGILCLHVLLMSSFVVLPQVMEHAGYPPGDHWRVYLITMLTSFVAVIPVIVYAEKKRHMKQVFMGCVVMLLLAEIVLWAAGLHLWAVIAGIQLFFLAFNVMEAILPSLISKESPAGYKGTAMGLYSTSQFIGVAIGGSLGGYVYGHAGAGAVFLVCAVIAVVWLLVSATMTEPPYVSSLRITLSELAVKDSALQARILAQPGVAEAVVVPEEFSAYVKVDTKQTNRKALEQLVSAA
ncbi:MFS transporter [Rahnella aquatilis]|uniref:Arabinose efflux permease family protein n=1 Tax=Rahnella aquatilis (strain ATCC 33071 / DSM 4594 / JCM 1683 / NBRC 105701 / NCIMB 13365 / CIP 78.65) TaxID=745277 RepID=H2IZJ7_RAHAC|nr:MFS transporter [Rahnella aquatilis]AEX53240.1 arabinose efflux permease family protein [Rahnella aquatilis CIP 78.65 = ATCC 33071]